MARCIKCGEKMEIIIISVRLFTASKVWFCDNLECENLGVLTVGRKKEKK